MAVDVRHAVPAAGSSLNVCDHPHMSDPEQVVREFFRLLAAGDARAAVELLDPEVVWRNTGLPTIKGRRAGAMLIDAEKRGFTVEVTLHHVATTGDVVL